MGDRGGFLDQQVAHSVAAQHRLGDEGGLGPVAPGFDEALQTVDLHVPTIGGDPAIMSSG
jgi:hypothetical protein